MLLLKLARALELANILLGTADTALSVFLDSLTSGVDQNAINSCAASSLAAFQTCESKCTGLLAHNECILACGCAYYFLALKYTYTSCWNQVT